MVVLLDLFLVPRIFWFYILCQYLPRLLVSAPNWSAIWTLVCICLRKQKREKYLFYIISQVNLYFKKYFNNLKLICDLYIIGLWTRKDVTTGLNLCYIDSTITIGTQQIGPWVTHSRRYSMSTEYTLDIGVRAEDLPAINLSLYAHVSCALTSLFYM